MAKEAAKGKKYVRPAKRARRAQLRKALKIALRELPEEEVIDILADDWITMNRVDRLQERFP